MKRTAMKGRHRDTGPDARTRRLVLERDNFRCVCCSTPIEGRPYSLQHRRARQMGGTRKPDANSPANLITVCGHATDPTGCHLWIEQRSEEARDAGYWVPSWRDPTDVPVHVYGVGVMYLDPLGVYLPAPYGGAA